MALPLNHNLRGKVLNALESQFLLVTFQGGLNALDMQTIPITDHIIVRDRKEIENYIYQNLLKYQKTKESNIFVRVLNHWYNSYIHYTGRFDDIIDIYLKREDLYNHFTRFCQKDLPNISGSFFYIDVRQLREITTIL